MCRWQLIPTLPPQAPLRAVVDPDQRAAAIATGGTVSIAGLVNTDPNQPDPQTYKGQYGTLTFTPSTDGSALAGAGSWVYTLDRDANATKALSTTETEKDTFILTYTVGETGSEVTYESNLVIYVTGDNNPVEFTETTYTQTVLETHRLVWKLSRFLQPTLKGERWNTASPAAMSKLIMALGL